MMVFTVAGFSTLYPYLYHLTATENIPRVRRLARLEVQLP